MEARPSPQHADEHQHPDLARLAEGGDHRRADDAAGAETGAQRAEHLRAAVQLLLHEQGQQQDVRLPEDEGDEHRSGQPQEVAMGQQVVVALAQVAEDALGSAALDVAEGGGDPQHHEQGRQQSAGGREVGSGDPQPADEDAADRRPGDAGQAVAGRVQRDGVHHVLLRHELRRHRLAGGEAHGEEERRRPPRRASMYQMAMRSNATSRPITRALARATAFPASKEVASVEAVGDHAHRYRAEAEGERPEALDDAQEQRRVGELDDEPAARRELDHQPDGDDEVADPEEPEVGIGQRRQRPRQPGLVTPGLLLLRSGRSSSVSSLDGSPPRP